MSSDERRRDGDDGVAAGHRQAVGLDHHAVVVLGDRPDRRVEVDGVAQGVGHPGGDGAGAAVDQRSPGAPPSIENRVSMLPWAWARKSRSSSDTSARSPVNRPRTAVSNRSRASAVRHARPRHPVGDGLLVPLVGPLGRPRRLDRHGAGHLVDPPVGPDEGQDGQRADLGDQAGVAVGLRLARPAGGRRRRGSCRCSTPNSSASPNITSWYGRQPGPAPVDRQCRRRGSWSRCAHRPGPGPRARPPIGRPGAAASAAVSPA